MNERPREGESDDASVPGYIVHDTGEMMRLYRVVRGTVATTEDFLSQRTLWERRPPERRRPAPTARYLQAIWDGVSVSATPALAAQQRARYPRIGNYVAILEVPVIQFPVQRSTETQGHLTLWGRHGNCSH